MIKLRRGGGSKHFYIDTYKIIGSVVCLYKTFPLSQKYLPTYYTTIGSRHRNIGFHSITIYQSFILHGQSGLFALNIQ